MIELKEPKFAYVIAYGMKYLEVKTNTICGLEVGKTFALMRYLHKDELDIGFTFYTEPDRIMKNSNHRDPNFNLLKVEILGDVFGNDDTTNRIKVIEEVPRSQYGEVFGAYYNDDSRLVKEVRTGRDDILYEYIDDSLGRIDKRIGSDGSIENYRYTENGHIVNYQNEDGMDIDHFYDESGNIAGIYVRDLPLEYKRKIHTMLGEVQANQFVLTQTSYAYLTETTLDITIPVKSMNDSDIEDITYLICSE